MNESQRKQDQRGREREGEMMLTAKDGMNQFEHLHEEELKERKNE